MRIPEQEVDFTFSRSSGPGGQNVNKLETRVQVRWQVGASRAFNIAEKERIRKILRKRLSSNDELILAVSQERSQAQNKELALHRLNNMVEGALRLPKKRLPTRPTLTSRLKRLAKKRRISLLKKSRKLIAD